MYLDVYLLDESRSFSRSPNELHILHALLIPYQQLYILYLLFQQLFLFVFRPPHLFSSHNFFFLFTNLVFYSTCSFDSVPSIFYSLSFISTVIFVRFSSATPIFLPQFHILFRWIVIHYLPL